MRAIQHESIRNFPELGLVLTPGVAVPVTPEQAAALEAHGITILRDEPAALPSPEPIPFHPPIQALDEEHD